MNQDDRDLTNLNWVSGLPLPVNFSVSPPGNSSSRALPSCSSLAIGTPKQVSTPNIAARNPIRNTPTPKKQENNGKSTEDGHKRPECSYTCLIGLALAASANGHLPVNEIYKYIESNFPYFKTAPDGWKNSIRHNLSLNSCFRKVLRTDGWQGKKGFSWEVTPDKLMIVRMEIEKFRKLGKGEVEKTSKQSGSDIPTSLYAKYIPSMPKTSKSKRSTATTTQPKKAIASSTGAAATTSQKRNVKIVPKPKLIKPKKQKSVDVPSTWPAFDTRNTPSEYIGFEAPPTDSYSVARDLFGLELSSPHYPRVFLYSPQGAYMGYDGGIMPLYTSPYYSPCGVFPQVIGNSPSPILSMSPPTPLVPSPNYMQSPFYATVPYSTPGYGTPNDGATFSGNTTVYLTPSTAMVGSCDPTPPSVLARRLMHTPVSLSRKKKKNKVNLADLLDFISEEHFDVEDPLQLNRKQQRQPAKGKRTSTSKTLVKPPVPKCAKTQVKAGRTNKSSKNSKALSKCATKSQPIRIGRSSSSVKDKPKKVRKSHSKSKRIAAQDSDDSLNISLDQQPTLELSSDHMKIYNGSVFPSDILSSLFDEENDAITTEHGRSESPDKVAHTGINIQGLSPEEKNHLLHNVTGSVEFDSLISKGFSYQQTSPSVLHTSHENSTINLSHAQNNSCCSDSFQHSQDPETYHFRLYHERSTPSTAVYQPCCFGSQNDCTTSNVHHAIPAMDSVYDETLSDTESMEVVGEITVVDESLEDEKIEFFNATSSRSQYEGYFVK